MDTFCIHDARKMRHAVHRCLPPPRVTFLSLHSWDQRKPTFRYIIVPDNMARLTACRDDN